MDNKPTLNACREVLYTLREYDGYLRGLSDDSIISCDSFVAEDLCRAVELISSTVYELPSENAIELISLLSAKVPCTAPDAEKSLKLWMDTTEKDIDILSERFFALDYDFERMMLTVERCSEDDLVRRLLSILVSFAEEDPSDFERLTSVYSDFAHFWGEFDPTTGKYDHFVNGIHAVRNHAGDIRWLYNTVEDYRSRKVIYGLVRFWLRLDFSYKNTIRENNYDDYFDLDILRDKISAEEVFVDCGAYTGDTAKSFFENFRSCKRMYLYDMLPANLEKAGKVLAEHDEIVYRNAGVSSPDLAGSRITVNNTETSTFSLGKHGEIYDPDGKDIRLSESEVELVTIDEDIKESISFLKMDIEGSEINALQGAREHIINDHPMLAISTYHHYEHLWEIPRLIRSMNPDYKLYIRYNGAMNGIMASEHAVLAI